jgi:hypothetical protein
MAGLGVLNTTEVAPGMAITLFAEQLYREAAQTPGHVFLSPISFRRVTKEMGPPTGGRLNFKCRLLPKPHTRPAEQLPTAHPPIPTVDSQPPEPPVL